MQLRHLAFAIVLCAGTAALAQAQPPEALPPGAIRGNMAAPFSPFGHYTGDQGGQFFEVTPVEAVENRYAGLPVPVDCPLNAPGWQEPHYIYHPGACDYSPPCLDHLWAQYCQIPCRCKPYCHTPHQRTGFRPCHHGHCGHGQGGCGSFGTCGLYQQPGGCAGGDCHGFRLHPSKRSCCDCDGCGDSLTTCPSCGAASASPTPAAAPTAPPADEQVQAARRPKIVTTKPALLSPPTIADPLPLEPAPARAAAPRLVAQPVGTSVAPNQQQPVLRDSGLSSVGPRAVRSAAAGSYYAK